MRILQLIHFANDTHTVIWYTCERCGAPVPCLTLPRYDDVRKMPRVRSRIGGCCGTCVLRLTGCGGPQDGEAVL